MLASKLLVLIDGRSVYTPLFAGVYWQAQATPLEDIERIEVIRGPGGTIWGANAVDGVINIITKNAKDTHGAMVSLGGGNVDQGPVPSATGVVTAGASTIVCTAWASTWGRLSPDGPIFDEWRMGQAGFRTDWDEALATLSRFKVTSTERAPAKRPHTHCIRLPLRSTPTALRN